MGFRAEGCLPGVLPNSTSPLAEMAKDKPRLCAALEMASAAIAKVSRGFGGSPLPSSGRGRSKPGWGGSRRVPPRLQPDLRGLLQEEEGKDDGDTLKLYQQSLGDLLLLLAGELWPWRVLRGRDGSRARG